MWKNLLSSVTSFAGGAYLYIIVGACSALASGYAAYSWTSDYYQVKIEHANVQALKEKDDIQRKGDQLVAQYIGQIDKLSANGASLQRQVNAAVGNGGAVVSNGFVRLYNSSATSQASSPSGADGSPSAVDLATVLFVAIENNEKYNKLANQLIDLQAFNK